MASNLKASAAMDVLTINKACTAAVAEGACLITGADFDTAVLPSGAAATKVLGIATNSTGATGERVNVMVLGVANALAVASATITQGDKLITANSSGHVKSWTAETAVDIVGIALETRTIGAAAEMIPVLLTGPTYLA
jgi:hypothetical protein